MNVQYREKVLTYTKIDALIALGIVALVFALIVFAGFQARNGVEYSTMRIWAVSFSVVLLCVVIVLFKKQGLSSIGFSTRKFLAALRLGLLFISIPILFHIIFPLLIDGHTFRPTTRILFMLFHSVVRASTEDIVIIGFVQTRIYGLIKNDAVAVILVAILFAALHLPERWFHHGGIFVDADLLITIALLMMMHVVLNAIFRRYSVIFPVVMLHTFTNFSQTVFTEIIGQHFQLMFVFGLPLTVLMWQLFLYRRKRLKK